MFVLSVQDEGMGIPKNKLNYIYDRFYQVDKSRSSKISTGLGLSIVKKIVELNQGTIDVESTLGIGSTFTVKLPINPKEFPTMRIQFRHILLFMIIASKGEIL